MTNRLHDEFAIAIPRHNHFIMEEELFERLGYPETDPHKAHAHREERTPLSDSSH